MIFSLWKMPVFCDRIVLILKMRFWYKLPIKECLKVFVKHYSNIYGK